MTEEEGILEKILKLLALAADSGATPGEAENAAAMASKLMFKHQIDQAKVIARQQKGKPSAQSAMYGRAVVGITKSAAWERELLGWLCYLYDCNLYSIWNEKWKFEVIGHKDNVALVAEMQVWLVKELGRLASETYKRERPRNDLGGGFDHMDPFRFHVSFKRGATSVIWNRLRKQKLDAEAEVRAESDGKALLVITEQIRDGALAHYHPYMKGWYDEKYGIESVEAQKEREARERARQWAKEQEGNPKSKARRGRMPRTYEAVVSDEAFLAGKVAGETVRLNNRKEMEK